MDSLQELKNEIDSFVEERDWAKFHTPGNLAKSLSIEAAELLECFQWNDTDYSPDAVKDELADVTYCCIRLASVLGLDLRELVLTKLEKNREKYPVEKARGRADKYDRL